VPGVEEQIRQALSEAQSGKMQEAMATLRVVLDEAPDQPDANWIMGTLLAGSGSLPAGIQHLERAVRHAPENPQMAYQLGAFYSAAGQLGPSVQMMQRAVQLAPTWHVALNGLATAMYISGNFEEADQLYRQSISANPGNLEAALGLAGLLIVSGRPQEAVDLFRRSAKTFPNDSNVLGKLASALNYAADATPEEIATAHRDWGAAVMAKLPANWQEHAFTNTREPERKLRVGFLSPDLFDHSVAYFLRSVLEGRDRERIEAVVYNLTARSDAMTQTLRSGADRWHDYAGRTEDEVATLIRTDGIDVLIELAGHTSGNSLMILRRRCAPVQATYIGYPNTTGLPTIDFRIVDAITDPPESDALHTEKLVRLEGCFLCYAPPERAPEVVPPPCLGEAAQRAGPGWDAGWFADARPVTFGSFNSVRKLSPATIDLWAKVLHAMPGSRLLLKTRGIGTPYAQRNVGQQFMERGIDPQRLGMAETVESKQEHWGWYGRVDIALDTTPYNGTTTTCEALWMGVPVVTLEGRLHAGRVGSSLLRAAGLPNLVAKSPEEFVRIAAGLAGDRSALASMRAGMRRQVMASALCDRRAYSRRFEGAVRGMWEQWCGSGA
jgi:protein O-GlcNAc transferase